MRQSDARIAQMAGVTFGPGYLGGLLMNASTVFWSRPPITAILAAGEIVSDAAVRMFSAIQRARYVEGRRVVDDTVLADLSAAIGLAGDGFAQALAAAPVDKHITTSRRLMQRASVQGFPAFLLERDGALARIDHQPFYGRPGDFVSAISAS